MPGFRQLTLDDMARKAAERVRIRTMMLKHIGEPGCPRLLLEASAALLRRGLCADVRARVIAYVLDDTRRPVIFARDLLVGYWRAAAKATAAAKEMGEILATWRGQSFTSMQKETRNKLKILVRKQVTALEMDAYGFEPGPMTTVGSVRKVYPGGLASGFHGAKVVALAMEREPRATFAGSLTELWEIRRRLYTETPPKWLFVY
jgi:hypothetical protein